MTSLEKVREKIAGYRIVDPVDAWGRGYNAGLVKAIQHIDAAIAEGRIERAKPEPGDVVAYIYSMRADGNPFEIITYFDGADEIYATRNYLLTVVLMRAADVRREIEEAGK